MDEARSASMPPSPEKKKPRVEAQSAIRSAIEMNDEGGSKVEYDEQIAQFTEEHYEDLEQWGMQEAMKKQMRDDRSREGDRLRQQKHRQTKRRSEIARGE